MSERLCKWCDGLIPEDSVRTVSVLSYGYTLVLDEIANRAHLLMSHGRTLVELQRRQPKTEILTTASSAEEKP